MKKQTRILEPKQLKEVLPLWWQVTFEKPKTQTNEPTKK